MWKTLFRQQFRRELRRAGLFWISRLPLRTRCRRIEDVDSGVDPDPVGYQHAGNDGPRNAARIKAMRPDVPVIMTPLRDPTPSERSVARGGRRSDQAG